MFISPTNNNISNGAIAYLPSTVNKQVFLLNNIFAASNSLINSLTQLEQALKLGLISKQIYVEDLNNTPSRYNSSPYYRITYTRDNKSKTQGSFDLQGAEINEFFGRVKTEYNLEIIHGITTNKSDLVYDYTKALLPAFMSILFTSPFLFIRHSNIKYEKEKIRKALITDPDKFLKANESFTDINKALPGVPASLSGHYKELMSTLQDLSEKLHAGIELSSQELFDISRDLNCVLTGDSGAGKTTAVYSQVRKKLELLNSKNGRYAVLNLNTIIKDEESSHDNPLVSLLKKATEISNVAKIGLIEEVIKEENRKGANIRFLGLSADDIPVSENSFLKFIKTFQDRITNQHYAYAQDIHLEQDTWFKRLKRNVNKGVKSIRKWSTRTGIITTQNKPVHIPNLDAIILEYSHNNPFISYQNTEFNRTAISRRFNFVPILMPAEKEKALAGYHQFETIFNLPTTKNKRTSEAIPALRLLVKFLSKVNIPLPDINLSPTERREQLELDKANIINYGPGYVETISSRNRQSIYMTGGAFQELAKGLRQEFKGTDDLELIETIWSSIEATCDKNQHATRQQEDVYREFIQEIGKYFSQDTSLFAGYFPILYKQFIKEEIHKKEELNDITPDELTKAIKAEGIHVSQRTPVINLFLQRHIAGKKEGLLDLRLLEMPESSQSS